MPPEALPPEPDRVPGAPHPREQTTLIGQDAAEAAFLEALRAGRLHHAWLLGGPRGVGKATFAYRVARFLLSPESERGEGLDVDPTGRAARQVAALSHPNLAVLRRVQPPDRKAPTTTIPVDAVRRAVSLFESTAANGGWRVCIVDSAEDLIPASGNALLKLIEEPPARAVFLIVSHAPKRILPTIRSRCRTLAFKPLSEPGLTAAIRGLGPPFSEESEDALRRAAALADGSVARAVEMLDEGALATVDEVNGLLADLERLDQARVVALAERVARREAEPALDLVLDTVLRWASAQIRRKAAAGAERLAPLAEVCENVARSAREADVYNLDRRPLVLTMFGDLATALRRAGG